MEVKIEVEEEEEEREAGIEEEEEEEKDMSLLYRIALHRNSLDQEEEEGLDYHRDLLSIYQKALEEVPKRECRSMLVKHQLSLLLFDSANQLLSAAIVLLLVLDRVATTVAQHQLEVHLIKQDLHLANNLPFRRKVTILKCLRLLTLHLLLLTLILTHTTAEHHLQCTHLSKPTIQCPPLQALPQQELTRLINLKQLSFRLYQEEE